MTSCKTQEEVVNQPTKNNSEQQFKSYFHDAIAEKMIGHYDRAVQLFQQCLSINANSSAVHFALSDIYEIQGNKNLALESAQRAFQIDKTNKWYALRLADLYFKMGDYQNSSIYYDLGINEQEKNIDLKFSYAEALIYSNQYQKAIVVMDEIEIETGKIPELSLTKHDMYMALGDEEKAQNELNTLISENPGNLEYRIIIADYFLQTNQPEKAKLIAEETILINPEIGSSYVILADVELRSGNLKAAFQHLQTAFKKDDVTLERKLELIWNLAPYAFEAANPDAKLIESEIQSLFELIYNTDLKNEQLHSYYGNFLKSQGNTKEALEQFKIVSSLKASDYNSWHQLLNIEYELGAYNDMFLDGQKAIDRFPAQPIFYLLTGIGASESKQYDAAEEYLFLGKDLVVQDNELASEFLYQLGKLKCLQKQYAQGYDYFEQAKKKFPQGAKVYGGKAKFLFEEGKIAEAEMEIKSGLQIDANNPNVLHIQGIIYLSKKDYPAALKSLEKAAVNDYKNGFILENYGDALFLTGSKEKAVQTWIEAEKNGNTSDLLKRKIADQSYYEN